MTFHIFLNLFSSFMGLIASIFFCLGAILLPLKKIDTASKAFAGGNWELLEIFLDQKVDYLCGAIGLILSFITQLCIHIPCLIPKLWLDSFFPIWVPIVVIILFLVGCFVLRFSLRKNYRSKINKKR